MRVDPVLEGVDRGHPREELDDALEVIALRALRVLLGIKSAQMRRGQQFHAHRGDLAKLDRRAAVGVQRQLARGEGVEGVAGLVQHGLDIAMRRRPRS